MVRIAVCGHIIQDDEASALEALAMRCLPDGDSFVAEAAIEGADSAMAVSDNERNGHEKVTVTRYDSPLDLLDAVADSKRAGLIDAIIAGTGMPGLSAIQLARELRAEGGDQRIVLIDDGTAEAADAAEAFKLRVDGYLCMPFPEDELAALLQRVLSAIVDEHRDSIVISAREGTRRIPLRRLLFSETVGHDQKIHVMGDPCCTVRISSQAFFDLLPADGRFFKAGSSYIVNIRLVCKVLARESSAVLFDGTVIPIPQRMRKSLENAILCDK